MKNRIYNSRNSQYFQKHTRQKKTASIYNSRNSQYFQKVHQIFTDISIYNSRNSQYFQKTCAHCGITPHLQQQKFLVLPKDAVPPVAVPLSTTVEILSTSKSTKMPRVMSDLQQQKFLVLPKGKNAESDVASTTVEILSTSKRNVNT